MRIVSVTSRELTWPVRVLPGTLMASIVARLRWPQVLAAGRQRAAPTLPRSLVRAAGPLLGAALGLAWRQRRAWLPNALAPWSIVEKAYFLFEFNKFWLAATKCLPPTQN